MDSAEFDDVAVEKNKAIAKFNRFRKHSELFHKLRVALALSVLSLSSIYISAVFKISGGRQVRVLAVDFFNHHVVFLIGNSIIVLLFVLSRRNGAGIGSGVVDVYENYVGSAEIQQATVVSTGDELTASANSPEAEFAGDGDGDDVKQVVDDAPRVVSASEQIGKLKRTSSQKLSSEHSSKPRPEIRRQNTEMRRIVLKSGDRRIETSLETVDSLSNEEFQLAIEAVIAEHQRFLYAQKLAEESNFV